MDCNSAQEQFSAYLLGALEAAEIHEVDLHVDRCDPCREALRVEGEIVVEMARLAPQIDAPDRVKQRLMSAIEAEPAGFGLLASLRTRLFLGPRWRLRGHMGMMLASASIVALALGGVWANGQLNEIAEAKDAMVRQTEVLPSPRSIFQDRLLVTYTDAAPELVVEELSATSRAVDARGMFLAPKSENSAVLVGLGLPGCPGISSTACG